MKSYFRALTIAGSDSGGGAGIQADLKTFSALGCFGMSAVTALTAQNTRVVTGIFPVPPEFIGQQIDAIMEDIGTDAMTKLSGTRINTPNSHGTGCTLSSAVCAGLAKGAGLETAVKNAKIYITRALTAGAEYTTGRGGHGPVNHFYDLWL